jgi:hypothetical protein
VHFPSMLGSIRRSCWRRHCAINCHRLALICTEPHLYHPISIFLSFNGILKLFLAGIEGGRWCITYREGPAGRARRPQTASCQHRRRAQSRRGQQASLVEWVIEVVCGRGVVMLVAAILSVVRSWKSSYLTFAVDRNSLTLIGWNGSQNHTLAFSASIAGELYTEA